MPDDVKNRIAELEKELYAKEFKPHATEDILTRKTAPVAPSWDTGADAMTLLNEQALQASRNKKMKKFVKISIGFFVVAVAVTAFIWWRGSNVISGDNIEINISAPSAVAGGDPFESTFVITNRNKVSVDEANLLVEYPIGFYAVANKTNPLPRISKDLGAIASGQSLSEKISTILYGQQNTNKEINVTLEYRLAGSNATLRKTTTYVIKISSSLVNLQLGTLKEVSSGQGVDFTVEVSSNSKDPLSTLIVEAVYPFGFNFISADPSPAYGTNKWRLSSLAPQEKRTIRIHGTLEGNENEEKIIAINVGTQNSTNESLIDIVYNSIGESMAITKPFLALDLALDNDHSLEHVVPLGRGVRADISWRSNNPTTVTDAVIEVKLKGNALNRYLIYASGGGFYRSSDDTIVWDKSATASLAAIEPGSGGSVSFGFSPVALGVDSGRVVKNPKITLEVNVRARRASDVNVSDNITTFASRTVKFETDLRLSARDLYYTGAFKNTGPLPPQANKETTYTIVLSARNASNDVSGAQVKTTLPIYVKWRGAISPGGEDVSFDEGSREVTWNIGRVTAGGSRDVAFQISFLPSLSQLGQAPALTGQIALEAQDDFTRTTVHDTKVPLTTYLLTDSSFVQAQAAVVD